jgi:enoyl-[acyl-carrier protein] reductase I
MGAPTTIPSPVSPKCAASHGAEIAFTYQGDAQKAAGAAGRFHRLNLLPADVESDEQLDAVRRSEEGMGHHHLVHLAFSDCEELGRAAMSIRRAPTPRSPIFPAILHRRGPARGR